MESDDEQIDEEKDDEQIDVDDVQCHVVDAPTVIDHECGTASIGYGVHHDGSQRCAEHRASPLDPWTAQPNDSYRYGHSALQFGLVPRDDSKAVPEPADPRRVIEMYWKIRYSSKSLN